MPKHLEKTSPTAEYYRRIFSAANAAAMLGKSDRCPEVLRVITLLKHQDASIRRAAIRTLTQVGGRDVAAFIAQRLDDADPEIRIAACQALGHMRAHATKPQLYDALADRNVWVRCAAAVALAAMGDKHGLPTIIRLVCVHGRHQIDALRSLNQITRREFPLTQQGILQAVRWIDLHKKNLLKF